MTALPDVIRCPRCGSPLAQLVAGVWILKHRRRQWVIAGEMVSAECECGGIWSRVGATQSGDTAAD